MTGALHASLAPYPQVLRDTAPEGRTQPLFLLMMFAGALLVGIALQLAEPTWFANMLRVKQGNSSQAAVTLLLSFAASVVLHELGHLAPSLCFGFYVSRIALGPICATRAHGAWKLQYSRNWFAASVVAIPRVDSAWRLRMLTVVAGGPIASFLTFLCAAYLLNELGPVSSAAPLLSVMAQLNLFLFLLGLVPNSINASIRNDARLFLTLLTNGCAAEQIRLYHRVTQLQIAGVRPRDYSPDLVASVAAASGNLDLMLFSALTVFLWAVDSGHIPLADVWDRRANALIEDHVLRLSDAVLCESACFDILHRNAPHRAVEKLKQIHVAALSPWLQYRATAALQIAEGTYSLAHLTLREARAALPSQRPYREFESAILDSLEQRADRRDLRAFVTQAAA